MTVEASWMRDQGTIELFSDTVKGLVDSTATKGSFRSNSNFYPKNIRIAAFVDTLTDNDSCDIDIEMAVKNNTIGAWTAYTLIATLTTDSLETVKMYDIPAFVSDNMIAFDSLKFLIDGDTNNDASAGVLVNLWLLWGDDGY
jgi:hypothetical protein